MTTFTIADDYAGFYKEHGYVVLTDLFPPDEIAHGYAELLALFESRFADVTPDGLAGEQLIQHFYESEKAEWRQCARRMFDLLPLYGLAARPQVEQMLRTLGMKAPMISTRPEVRTDMPKDQQYMQPWHQDWRYGQGSLNAITTWTPLHDVSVENGAVEVMPGTHRMGYLETTELSDPRRFLVTDARTEGLPHLPVELRAGQTVVFSQFLLHRSGFNRTDRPRLTVQCRFSDFRDSAFVANGFPTPASSDLAWPRYPTAEEVRSALGLD